MSFQDDIKKAIKELSPKRLQEACTIALGRYSEGVVNDAKSNLRREKAINNGGLVNSIYAEKPQNGRVNIIAGASYAAFIEFGTRKFAASYVASLPKEWKDLASQSKGKGGGTFKELVQAIAQWVADKSIDPETAITGTFSIKTRKRTGSKKTKEEQNLKAAYPIVKSILKNGIRARPYLYPAVVKNQNKFAEELAKVFK